MRESVIFKNPGLIEILSIKTLGINVKEGENPFGYFGTGLKYAIGILLRNNCKITIWRGEEKFDFALKPVVVRGKDFSIVTMNGEELGFTSGIGKNWELWMAYRELYCNTLDESGDVFVGLPTPQKGTTTIAVEGESFLSTHHRRRDFILQSSPFETFGGTVEIHEGGAEGLFFKGILVGGISKSRFTYNMVKEVTLTEDRTLKELFSAEWEIVRAVKESKNEHFIETVLTAGEGFFEWELHFNYSGRPSDTFLEVARRLIKEGHPNLTESLTLMVRKYVEEEPISPVTLTRVQEIQLARAKKFTKELGLFTDEEFPLIVAETLGKGILGLAKRGTIYFAVEVFEMGTKMVAITLIEEYIHLKHGHGDMTRDMQNLLFNKIISLGEELAGEPL